jgi:hypothetical protein
MASLGDLRQKLNNIPKRFKQFVTHDVKRNPILGLYLIIGAMVVGYLIYFVIVIYKDVTTPEDKRLATKPKAAQVKKPPPVKKKPPPPKKPPTPKPTPAKPKGPEKAEAVAKVEPKAEKVPEKPRPAAPVKAERADWKTFDFPDASRISFPPDWTPDDIPAEKSILYGIRLQAPGAAASLKCYSRARQKGDDLVKSLKDTMSSDGKVKVAETKKKKPQFEVTELSAVLADKHMIVSVFDHQPDRYFIVSLIATDKDYKKIASHYNSIVDSYVTTSPAAMSIESIEKQLQKSIEEEDDYLVGTYIKVKLKGGARHKGVVIAEDDNTLTLEGFRFGGKYSFTFKKEDIAELIR